MGSKQKLSLVLVVACFFCVPAYGQQPRLELIEVGGPVATPAIRVTAGGPVGDCDPANTTAFSMDVPSLGDGNIARAADAVTFGSPAASCRTDVDNINDGLYGACSAWKGGYSGADSKGEDGTQLPRQGASHIQDPVFSKYVGIYWTGGGRDIYEIALGRDNVNPDRHFDGACGLWARGRMEFCSEDCFPFKIYYRTAAFAVPGGGEEKCPYPDPCDFTVDPNCQDAAWINDGSWIELGDASGHIATSTVGLRHRYRLVDDQGNDDPLQNVQAIRIVNWPILGGVSIDEVEIGDAPNALGAPPSTDLVLRETGGPFTSPAATDDVPTWDDDPEFLKFNEQNLARRADAVAFASNPVGVEKLNDGLYGDAWEGNAAPMNATIPGDCNEDGSLDLSDAICTLGFLFQNNPSTLPCSSTAANLGLMDVNDDGAVDLSDAIYLLAFLFQGGAAPVQGQGCTVVAGCSANPGCSAAGAGAGTAEVFAGIYFKELITPDLADIQIQEIALGRDNTGVETDRAVGEHRIQFTTDTFDPASLSEAAAANWQDVHSRRTFARAHIGASNAGLRRRYLINDPQSRYFTVNDPIQARAIRIVTQEGNAFDEIELGGFERGNKVVGLRVDYERKLPALTEDLSEHGGPVPRSDVTGERDVPTWEDGNVARARTGLPPERDPCAYVGDVVPDPPCTGPYPQPWPLNRSDYPGTSTGAVAFGSMPFNVGKVFSTIARINDGIYGPPAMWTAGGPAPQTGLWYVGIYWTDGPRTINRIALGRDNNLVAPDYGDRHSELFTLQYVPDDLDFPHERWVRPDEGVAESAWISIGTLGGHKEGTDRSRRHLYDFDEVTARAIRVLVENQKITKTSVPSFQAIDELEIFESP